MTTYAEDNPFPYITLVDTADPTTPAAGTKRLWVDTDDALKIVNESDVVTVIGTGSVASDPIWDAAGDLVQGTGANTAAKLSAGTAGHFLKSAGAAAANLWAFPPGYEADYAERTSNLTVNATSEGTGLTVVATAGATLEAVPYWIEVFAPRIDTAASATLVMDLYEDSTILGRIGIYVATATGAYSVPFFARRRRTPTAASHTYTWKAWRATADCSIYGASGGTGANLPAYIRVVKA